MNKRFPATTESLNGRMRKRRWFDSLAMTLSLIALLGTALVAGCMSESEADRPESASDSEFLVRTAPIVQHRDGEELHQYWTFADDPELWDTIAPSLPALRSYRDRLAELAGDTTALGMIRRNGEMFPDRDNNKEEELVPEPGMAGIAAGEIGFHRRMNCLESHLLAYQAGRFDMLQHPTEFHAFILKRESAGENEADSVRVYFAASDQEFPPKPVYAVEALKADTGRGWRLYGHLHNHTANLSSEKGHLPVAAPSLPDRQYYGALHGRFALSYAFVIDGFNAIVLNADDIVALAPVE